MVAHASVGTQGERWLGPYRLLRTLGKGGMGEVVLAEDPRLSRYVAIKRLRAEKFQIETSERGEIRRQRLQREARVLAKLRHPAIVQVFELLSTDDGDHLVMEFVDGPNLRQAIEEHGPLPTGEVMMLGKRLAAGLEHAHRHGVVHRDLKTENVLLDREGEPRISDFGLAWSASPTKLREEGLTAEGQVVGTARAMAPEQISGDPVDARCDLFAFGVLLVELLTGHSPFAASTRQATIRKVLTEAPPSLRQTGAPEGLIGLIEHLLEKEPAHRPRSAAEVVDCLARLLAEGGETATLPAGRPKVQSQSSAHPSLQPNTSSTAAPTTGSHVRLLRRLVLPLLILSGIVGVFAGFRALIPSESEKPLHVAVLATEVQGLETNEAGILSLAVRSAALRALSALDRVVPLGSAEVDAVAVGRVPREVATATAADQVLSSEVRCGAADCWLELARFDGVTGELLWSESLEAPRAEPHTLAWATEKTLGGSLDRERIHDDPPMPPELVAEVLPLRLAGRQGQAGINPQETFHHLSELSARFGAQVELDLWQARMASQAFATSRDGQWLERARKVLDSAAKRAPGDTRIELMRADIELVGGQIDAADSILQQLAGQLEGDIRFDEMRARLAMARGDSAEALERMQRVVARRPSWTRLYNLARMASQTGEIELAFKTLDALDQRAPNGLYGRRLRANLELKFGDLEKAAALYGELASATTDVAAWTNLGVAHLLRRDAEAARTALEQAHLLAPENPLVQLNLADAHTLAESRDSAETLYRKVLDGLDSGPDTDLQTLTVRAQAQARLGRRQEAVADLEAAIRRAPEDPSVRFEAALVFALIGDLASAERNRRRALELGFEERWFSLAAFDALD